MLLLLVCDKFFSFFLIPAKDQHLFEVFSESVNVIFLMSFWVFFSSHKQQNLDWKSNIYLNFYSILCSLVSYFQNCGDILDYIRKIIRKFLKILKLFLFLQPPGRKNTVGTS